MAGSVRCLIRNNLSFLTKNVTQNFVLNQKRTLFNEQSLGMLAYNATRNAYKNKFLNLEDSFREKMKTYVDNEASGMIFTEDLKVMLHLVEKTPEDEELIIKMLNKYNGQSEDMRFTTFLFGPIAMRAFYRINEPDLALKMFKDPAFNTFFNQLASYQILLDLLYENKRYEEMREIYDMVREKLTEGKVHPRNALILVTAACYKENTPESWKYALDLWRDLDKRGTPTVRRVIMHLAALGINQGDPQIALEILIRGKKPRYIALRCLKIMAYCDLDRLNDVIPYFRASLEQDDPSMKKETYFKDTIERVEAAIERNNISPDSEIRNLLKLIKSGNFIQENTLDDHMNEEITVVPRTYDDNRDDSNYKRKFQSSKKWEPRIIRRPGLRELV